MKKSCGALVPMLAAAALLLVGAPQALEAQQAAVGGTVTDAQSGQPIAGAQVAVRGTGIGTLTNNDGRYVLTNVPAGRVEIRVEYIGYSPRQSTITVAAGETATLDFQMGVEAIQLEELVATGYAQQTRREVSSAISTVNAEQIENQVVASLDAALQGKAAGVQVIQNAGNPGNGITVRVRGSASISASNQPLYVVDGVPIFREDFGQLGLGGQDLSAITGLNPDEIESIDILKDAAASAIYGSRGSNGVILITTKRGATGAARFTLNVSAGRQEQEKKIDLLNTAEWIDYFSVAMANDGYTPADIQDELDWLGVDPSIDTDWQDEVTRTAPVTNTQIAVNGGTERFKYFLSGSYFDQQGIVIGSAYDRSSGRLNLDFQATDRLSLTTSLSLAMEDNDRIESDNSIESAVTNSIANEPWTPVYNDDGSFSGAATYANPVGVGMLNEVNARTLRSFGNVLARFQVADWLTASGRAGFDVLALREYRYFSPLVPKSDGEGAGGIAQVGNSQGRKYLLEGFLNASRFFGPHEVSLTAGSSVEMNDRELSFVEGEGFSSSDLHWPANAARVTDYDGTAWEHNLLSYFGRGTYTFADRYIVNASLRADGSSRFGPENKYGVFPAVSAAWVVTNEGFMQGGFDFLSDLKLRASWGKTGNEAIPDFEYLGLFDSDNYGDLPGTAPSNLPNPNLKWETTSEWNLGMDASFFEDRVGILAEVYDKTTEDLLFNRPITATTGFTSVLVNVGSIQNRGWELGLRTVNVRAANRDGFEWSSDFNITHNENTVLELFSIDPTQPGDPFPAGFYNRVEEGQPLGVIYTYNYEGPDPETGDALYTDLDADGNPIGVTTEPNSGDRMIVGSPHPDYFGGLRNTIEWRGFSAVAFLEFSQGAEIINAMREFADDGGYFYDNKFRDVLDYWTPENPDASDPRPSYFGESGARLPSSRWVEDGSYVRLGEVTVGYQIPASVANMLRSSEARVYVSGRNLKTWTDYTGYSPDVNSFGSGGSAGSLGTDFYAYPTARTFTIGFQGTW